MKKIFFLIAVIFLFTACTMPETKIYSLSLPAERKMPDNKSVHSVNIRVHAPRYLTQPYLAFRISPYQVDISRYAKWEATPLEIVREAFRDTFYSSGISNDVKTLTLVPAGYYSVDIQLRRFERTGPDKDPAGEIGLEVAVSSPDGKEIYRETISKKTRLQNKDNTDLAKALSSSLSEGVEEALKGIAGAMDLH